MTDFDHVYSEYFSSVYKYVLALSRDETIAEEVTQETFFKALRSIDQFKGTCKLYVWLCQIAKNTYFTLYQKQKRTVPGLDHDVFDVTFDVESAYLDKETTRLLHVMLHQLKEPYREVFTLRVFAELPFQQIGELFGKTDSWARLIFFRAKKQMQEDMK